MVPSDSPIVIFEYITILYTLPAIDSDFWLSQTTLNSFMTEADIV